MTTGPDQPSHNAEPVGAQAITRPHHDVASGTFRPKGEQHQPLDVDVLAVALGR